MTQLSDLRLAAQQRCDRVNATTITTAEWNSYINYSAAALYRKLTSTYEDYNVASYQFTLAGGVGGNTLTVGAGSAVPAFDKLRKLTRQVAPIGTDQTFAPVLRADSFMEFDLYTSPALNPLYGNVQVKYWMYGTTIEVRPASSAGATYVLWYVPIYTKLVLDTDTIDGSWLATSGVDEWIIIDAARKALIKEESLDTAALLLQERDALTATILKELQPRDDHQPGRIADVKRMRAAWGFGDGRFGGWGGP